ncbi:ABC transporter ATP-binding protein [Salinimonas iocasae]|uniref:ABC transporter ATP-binding protein n=1 Tax=Salinimonas iocasae TaxID=2572577 RepID=A0A5B7YBN1_9ALTE|nr:ABC transporter ATP-binding protein [Salinimonas iocasae]QCZ92920.1 ABC transporter ATP-binding protein [Salinimonas iocasae]
MLPFNHIRELLDRDKKVKFLILQVCFVFSAALQMASIAFLAPYITLLSDPAYLETNKYFSMAYDYTGAESYLDFLLIYSVCVCSIIFISNAVASAVLWLSIKFTIDIGSGLQRKLYSAFMKNQYIFFLEKNSSHLITTISNQVPRMVYMVFQPFLQAVSQVVLTLFIVIGLIVVDPALALIAALIVTSVYIVIYFAIRRRAVESGKTVSEVARVKLKMLRESIKGIREIKLLGAEPWYEKEVDKTTRKGLSAQAFIRLSGELPRYIVETVVFSAIIVLGVYLITSGTPQTQIVTTLSFYAMAGYKLLPAAQTIYKAITSIKGNASVVDEVWASFTTAKERAKHITQKQDTSVTFDNFQKMHVNAVDYQYPNSDDNVIADLNMTLEVNKLVAFVGGSGAGKTTVANLVAGLITPSQGSIEIDGDKLTHGRLRAWQDKIGYVPQSVFIVDDTVTANICFGVPKAEIDQERVVEVAKKANLHEFIASLSDGYDTKVGEDGEILSGGQRQRLAIARALYKQPSVLILDEATSALDNITERRILSEINTLTDEMLVIMIAHRLSTVEKCDMIYLFEQGRIQHQGNYQQLLTQSDYFRELVEGNEETA